jgi:hypothetical protein
VCKGRQRSKTSPPGRSGAAAGLLRQLAFEQYLVRKREQDRAPQAQAIEAAVFQCFELGPREFRETVATPLALRSRSSTVNCSGYVDRDMRVTRS